MAKAPRRPALPSAESIIHSVRAAAVAQLLVAREAAFDDTRRQLPHGRAEEIDLARGDICRDLSSLRTKLDGFADVTAKQMQQRSRFFSEMLELTRGVGLLDVFCRVW